MSQATPEEVLDAVRALPRMSAVEGAAVLRMTPGQVAGALRRAGKPGMAAPFERAARRANRARRAAAQGGGVE